MRRFLLLATVVAAGVLMAGMASAAIILVPAHYPSIQSAIDHALDGDAILVSPDDYHENLVVDKQVQIVGSGADVTKIYPAVSDVGPSGPPVFGNSQVIVVAATDVLIQGFTIDGDSELLTPLGTLDARNGIILDHTLGNWGSCFLQDLIITNMYMSGIYLRGATFAPNNEVKSIIVSNVNSVAYQSAGITMYNASAAVHGNSLSFCALGIACLSGSGGHVYSNVLGDNVIGILVSGNGSTVEVGSNNNVINYADAGIQASQAAAPVNIHHNLVTTTTAPGPDGSTAIGVFGQAIAWTGTHEIKNNTLSGPASAANSYGCWIDTYSGSTVDVHALLQGNTIHFFDVGVLLVDSDSNPAGLHDVSIATDSLYYNDLSTNGSYALKLEICDDSIDARGNDWGKYTPGEIEVLIHHKYDDVALGFVTFEPFKGSAIATESATWGVVKRQFE